MDLTQYNNGAAYDATAYTAPTNDFAPIPAGIYPATISHAEVKQTRAGDGSYVEVTYSIIGQSHEGRRVWHRCNIVNKNPKAVEIGNEQLHKIREAAGLVSLSNTDQLIGANMQIKIIVKDDRNEVKDVSELHQQAQQAPQALPAAPPQFAPAPTAPPAQQAPPTAPQAPAMPWQQPAPQAPAPQGGQYEDVRF
jgi:hypothetical protein